MAELQWLDFWGVLLEGIYLLWLVQTIPILTALRSQVQFKIHIMQNN